MQTHSHSLPMDHPSPCLLHPEALSPVWSWYVGHRARSMYTPALGWIKYPVLSIEEKTTSASLRIFSGGSSLNVTENCCMSTSFSYFFVGPYLDISQYFAFTIQGTWLLGYCSVVPSFHLLQRLFPSPSLIQLFY